MEERAGGFNQGRTDMAEVIKAKVVEAKHTPFLWLNDGEESAKSNDGKVILEGGRCPAVFLHGEYAIAPELLAVCEHSADTFRDIAQAMRLLKHDTIAEAMIIAEDAARAAIAKAKVRE